MHNYMKLHKNGAIAALMAGVVLFAVAEPAMAGTALAWEKPICLIAHSLSGPIARAVAIIIFVLSGLAMAAGEASGVMKTLLMTVFGLTLALMGAQWLGFLNQGGAAAAAAPGVIRDMACTF